MKDFSLLLQDCLVNNIYYKRYEMLTPDTFCIKKNHYTNGGSSVSIFQEVINIHSVAHEHDYSTHLVENGDLEVIKETHL